MDPENKPAEISANQVHDAIADLLELCKSQNVEVPKELKASLDEIVTQTSLTTSVSSSSSDILATGVSTDSVDVAVEEEAIEATRKHKKKHHHHHHHSKDDPPGHLQGFQERLISDRSKVEEMISESKIVQQAYELMQKLKIRKADTALKVQNGSYTVIEYLHESDLETTADGQTVPRAKKKQKIATVYTAGPMGVLQERLKRIWRTKSLRNNVSTHTKVVMKEVNLYFEPGKTYLVLGGPGSGKSTLLKMIAGILPEDRDHKVDGTVMLNQFDSKKHSSDIVWSNLVGYIDQIDRLHPFLTVQETCEFAWRCRMGGTHRSASMGTGPEADAEVKRMDEQLILVNLILEGMGLKRVSDTFVGDQQKVRGVSGGEKKRVTVAEMQVGGYPVLCMDEISTGLDAATTYDICKLTSETTALRNGVRVVSLLQPPPETFALFDELILLSEGQIIYSGPMEQVVPHFESLGYTLPDRMDVADWLQALPTKDGAQFLNRKTDGNQTPEQPVLNCDEFRQKFYDSDIGKSLLAKVNQDMKSSENDDDEAYLKYLGKRYRNSPIDSLKLLIQREMLLWWRDKTQIVARVMQDLVMGIIAGTLFWQANDDPTSIMGILFQSMFFVSVGAMLKIAPHYSVRGILYKHQDANFFPTWTYVVGKSLASIPASIIDGIVYGTVIFWFVGLAHDEGASVGNYFMFMLIILMASVVIGLQFSIFPAITNDRSTGQACMSIATLLLVLFSGYTVQPDVIPEYWIWMYWFNTFSWALRGLAVNEFDSGKYDMESGIPGQTVGQATLTRFGFVDGNGDAYTFEWAWWSVVYSFGICIAAVIIGSISYNMVRFATGKSLGGGDDDDEEEMDPSDDIALPFQKVDLTFKDVHYYVQSSVGNERLELLKGVDGIIKAGKMTALMGSSGAGKTTLMDVLAMRKTSGEIEGDIRLNGHPQEENSFRRSTGYVEQFDTQSAQLTIRETCMFSAKLRLDSSDPEVTPASTEKFVDQTLHMLELYSIRDLQVGDDNSGGLSFEQRKRLSIAVELVANPSIIFLDEPTSGLDARAASIVMRGLKRIASSGRAVCATIHQPSIAIFNSFDSLLLLKRGGETIFFGELGNDSKNLIEYLEQYEDTPKIQPGENPATWMLTTIGAGSATTDKKPFDYAGNYQVSDLRKNCLKEIDDITSKQNDENQVFFSSLFATSTVTQIREVLARTRLVYWRSPSYNMVRLAVSAVLALLIGSVYVSSRVPENESDMNSRATTIFMAYLFIAVNSLNTVLAVFEAERNMYYRHKAALMYDKKAILLAFTVSEAPFILLSSFIYVSIFYFMIGFAVDAAKFFMFWFFMFLNMANFTFLGQMFVALNRDSVTAQGFGGLAVSLSSLFTGVLIRPENIPSFWTFMYWVMPGHYIYEGLLASQFENDETPIIASPNTPFWHFIGCNGSNPDEDCIGTAEQWVFASFGGNFLPENIPWNILYLLILLIVSRTTTGLALAYLNFRRT